jgi:hypothetical protein
MSPLRTAEGEQSLSMRYSLTTAMALSFQAFLISSPLQLLINCPECLWIAIRLPCECDLSLRI